MRKLFFVFLFLFYHFGFSQETISIEIDWLDSNYNVTENLSQKIPNFKNNTFIYNDVENSIVLQKNIPTNGVVNVNSLDINSVVYEDISEDKLGILNKDKISNSIKPVFLNSNARDETFAVLYFNPIIKIDNVFKRVKNITFSYALGLSNKSEFNRSPTVISNSVLKTGSWNRFYVEKSGVYALTKTFLSEMGVNVNVDPRTIKIFGNGGRMIPLANSIPYPIDITENAVYFVGEQDGVFNDSDYILFYAEGMDNWNVESETFLNNFSDRSYYYVTSSASNGKRITAMVEPTAPATKTYTTFNEEVFYEVDKVNIVRLGRQWFGDQYNVVNEKDYNFSLPNVDITKPVTLKVKAAAAAFVGTKLDIKLNTALVGTSNFVAINPQGPVYATDVLFSKDIAVNNPNMVVNLNYNNSGVPSSNGYLDYISLNAVSFLKGNGHQYRFTVNETKNFIGTCQYQISNANTISQVWDITDIYNVTNKINNAQTDITFKSLLGDTKKFVVVENNDYMTPLKETSTAVSNQDLKGTIFLNNQGVFQDVDYIIVTPASLAAQAENLASFHRNYSQLNVKVVTLESLYVEFGSGKQDIGAIRNFVKYVYENASISAKKLKYLCLFGDASFDFKNRIPNNTNVVPIYHSLYSFSVASSYISDDYFGLLDANEGNMANSQRGLDVAVGRIIANNPLQAEQLVNKIIDYHDVKSFGKWRNNAVMISDDIGKDSDKTIQTDLNELADKIILNKPFINVKKIHCDSYVQEVTSGGQRYPKANEDILTSFQQGSLIFDYFGHGGEEGLGGERIFEKADTKALSNKFKYPLFITVTCEFSRFDNPYNASAGEYLFWNPQGGAVSMVTTTRQIGQSTGSDFNKKFIEKLLPVNSNNYPSIGEAVRTAKVANLSTGNDVVFYFGDPAMKLAIPLPKIKLTKFNDLPIATANPVLSALSFVKLSGEVTDELNNSLSDYNGDLSISIYDKDINRVTLGNDGFIQGGVLITMPFIAQGETIFRGNASVVNGKFDFSFMVPKDIRIPLGNGKVSFYAKKTGALLDKSGYDFSVKVGGINSAAVADTTPPTVHIYMNNQSFVSGGTTNQSPLFLAFLEDDHGINTASGIGHDIVAILDGNLEKPYILNDFYETELNDYTKGKLKFPFKNLSVGLHHLTFKAWDVYNNLITAELDFIVAGDETLTLTNVLNYPNPFVNYTEFWFTHNKPFEPLEVQVQIFTINGKMVWTKNQLVNTDGFLSRDIIWDGRDDFGDKIGKGVYVYKLTVKSTITNIKTEKIEKLVIL